VGRKAISQFLAVKLPTAYCSCLHYTTRRVMGALWTQTMGFGTTVPHIQISGGTAAAAPAPFRLSDPALCGSHPLVAPY